MPFPAASAQEVCLKDLPDSAWSNGEPQNLDRQGLSTRFLLNAPGESLIRYENVPIQLVYQYLGNTSITTECKGIINQLHILVNVLSKST